MTAVVSDEEFLAAVDADESLNCAARAFVGYARAAEARTEQIRREAIQQLADADRERRAQPRPAAGDDRKEWARAHEHWVMSDDD